MKFFKVQLYSEICIKIILDSPSDLAIFNILVELPTSVSLSFHINPNVFWSASLLFDEFPGRWFPNCIFCQVTFWYRFQMVVLQSCVFLDISSAFSLLLLLSIWWDLWFLAWILVFSYRPVFPQTLAHRPPASGMLIQDMWDWAQETIFICKEEREGAWRQGNRREERKSTPSNTHMRVRVGADGNSSHQVLGRHQWLRNKANSSSHNRQQGQPVPINP